MGGRQSMGLAFRFSSHIHLLGILPLISCCLGFVAVLGALSDQCGTLHMYLVAYCVEVATTLGNRNARHKMQ